MQRTDCRIKTALHMVRELHEVKIPLLLPYSSERFEVRIKEKFDTSELLGILASLPVSLVLLPSLLFPELSHGDRNLQPFPIAPPTTNFALL